MIGYFLGGRVDGLGGALFTICREVLPVEMGGPLWGPPTTACCKLPSHERGLQRIPTEAVDLAAIARRQHEDRHRRAGEAGERHPHDRAEQRDPRQNARTRDPKLETHDPTRTARHQRADLCASRVKVGFMINGFFLTNSGLGHDRHNLRHPL